MNKSRTELLDFIDKIHDSIKHKIDSYIQEFVSRINSRDALADGFEPGGDFEHYMLPAITEKDVKLDLNGEYLYLKASTGGFNFVTKVSARDGEIEELDRDNMNIDLY